MSNEKLFRIAGWCALGCVVVMIAALISIMLSPSVGVFLEILFLLGLIVVFYALYVAHRSEAGKLSLAGLVLAAAAVVVDLLSLLNEGNVFLLSLWYVLISLAFLIIGYLAWRSSKMPRGVAVAALVAGAFSLITGLGGFLGSESFNSVVRLLAVLAMLVWLIWLWRVFWSKKLLAP
jgi:hypothetical protein